MSVSNNKLLIIMRQEMPGFASQGEATGYAKLEWIANRCKLQFGAQSMIAQEKGEYFCVLYIGGETYILGDIVISRATNIGYKSFELASKPPALTGVIAAGIMYADKGFLYPVLCGHKGGGAIWSEELIISVCKKRNLRRGVSYTRWSYTDNEDASSDEAIGDTLVFKPITSQDEKKAADQHDKTGNEATNEAGDKAAERKEKDTAQRVQGKREKTGKTDYPVRVDPVQKAAVTQKKEEWMWEESGLEEPEAEFEAMPTSGSSGENSIGDDEKINTEDEFSPEDTKSITEENFYGKNKEHFERLLLEHEPIDELKEMIPGSSWARVEYRDGEEQGFYIVGIIYDEDQRPMHICYGVPGVYSDDPPKGLSEFCQWMPAKINQPKADGYWMLYQSALTGETLENK